jgi:argininosuccinate lyase
VSDPLVLATDAAEALVRDGVPFREAHERVAASVRDGTFAPAGTPAESVAGRAAPGPGGVHDAVAAARSRFTATP